MARIEPVTVQMSVEWDKKSKKIGKVLELLAEAIEKTVDLRMADERLAMAAELDRAFDEGYDVALEQVQKFGLPFLVARRTMNSTENSIGEQEG